MGIGIIMPVLPALLREFVGKANVAENYGVLLALYAMMQVILPSSRPLVRSHRSSPCIITFTLGATLDYALMATASVVWVLYLGRLIAGITGATGAVAASTIADVTPEESRTHWFGMMGALFWWRYDCWTSHWVVLQVNFRYRHRLCSLLPLTGWHFWSPYSFYMRPIMLIRLSDEIKNETINETTSSIREMISPLSGLLVVFSSFN